MPSIMAQEEKTGVAELKGTWKLVAAEFGQDDIEVPLNFPHWVIKGDTVRYGGEPLAKLAIGATATPKTMDLTFLEEKRDYEAIYVIDGDKLKICVNTQTDGVKERPLDFTVKGKENRRLLVFERQKAGTGDGTADAPGFVGIQIGKNPDGKGVRVVAVIEKSPAKKAGVKQDDIVLRVGTTAVDRVLDCVDLIRQVRPGSDVTLHVLRGDMEREITVRARVIPFFILQ
jgi:uncharacterized protein (TIGR03067 family)